MGGRRVWPLATDGVDTAVELGPLSLVALRGGDAALIRLIPKFPGQTEVEIVQLPRGTGGTGEDGIGEALRDGDAIDGSRSTAASTTGTGR